MTLIDSNYIHPSSSNYLFHLKKRLKIVNCQILEDGRIIEILKPLSINPISYDIFEQEESAVIITEYIALSRQTAELWNYADLRESSDNSPEEKELSLDKANAWGAIEEYLVYFNAQHAA
jgi:hypothetical protein